MTTPTTTTDLPAFAGRHIGPREEDVSAMLEVIGRSSLDDLMATAVPDGIRAEGALDIEPAASEAAVLEELREVASRNRRVTSMIGLGYYGTLTPAVIQRNVLENPAWYTAYTPYQPEISQGRLEALLNFQTVVSDLTGLPIAGASLLDEATAAAEAMTLMRRSSKAPADAVLLVDEEVFPQTLGVVRTRALPLHIPVVVTDLGAATTVDHLRAAAGGAEVFGVLVQYPAMDGTLRDLSALAAAAHEAGALVAAAADLLALTLATPPGEWGVDVTVGSTQRFGVPIGFGGPHAGYLACGRGWSAPCPGASSGSPSTPWCTGIPAGPADPRAAHPPREGDVEHLHRAGPAGGHGEHVCGVPRPGRPPGDRPGCPRPAEALRAALVEVVSPSRTARSSTPCECGSRDGRPGSWLPPWTPAEPVAGRPGHGAASASTRRRPGGPRPGRPRPSGSWPRSGCGSAAPEWPEALRRALGYLTHPVFTAHHSETAMLRYLRRLADGDFALDRHDPARVLHDEAQRHDRDGRGDVARVRRAAPLRPARADAGIRGLVDELSGWLVRDHGVRRGVAAAQRRVAGGAVGPARDRGIPPLAR